ncbi:MAG: hypothetical protein HEQ17_11795 [Limnohabitans sp.]|nr:hypothetical protein [Limnohabitans sp.]
MDSVRWNIAVSPDPDQSVRMFIASGSTDLGLRTTGCHSSCMTCSQIRAGDLNRSA